MQWDVALSRGLANTLFISGGAACLATLLAACFSLLIFHARIIGGRTCAGILGSFLLIPVYVQATAWSAGFGEQGWFRLSQVAAAKNPTWGLLAVIWIHATAALPVCFLILSVGMRRVRDSTYEQAWVEFGPRYVVTRVLPRRLAPWLAGAWLWAICMTQNDMVVTNLFQVPTLCESVYQQVQFGKLRSEPIATALVLSGLCGAGMAWLMHLATPSILPRQPTSIPVGDRFAPVERKYSAERLLATFAGWLMVGFIIGLPIMSMCVRIGTESRVIEQMPTRAWSWNQAGQSLMHGFDYAPEIGWSLSLSFWSSVVAMILAGCALACASSRMLGSMVGLVLGFLLAMPGPLVNLAVLWLLDSALPAQWSFLADRTLIGPILALQTRCLPIAFGVIWIARSNFQRDYGDRMAMERGLAWWDRQRIWLRYASGSFLTAWMIAFLVAFGDLASYLLVQPPGVTTVAMRLFDLLHYGTRNREASLALILAIAAALPSLWLANRVQRVGRDSGH